MARPRESLELTKARAEDHTASHDAGTSKDIALRPTSELLPARTLDLSPGRWGSRAGLYLALGWLTLVIFAALFAAWLPIEHYGRASPALRQPPNWSEPFGTDFLGRSQLSRVIYGSRVSLAVGLASVAIGATIGGAIGLIAGYFKGRTDRIAGVGIDALLAFPPFVFLVAIRASLGKSLTVLVIALGVITVPWFARLARANTLVFAEREFVQAARGLGARDRRIMVREILPNVVLPVASYAVLVLAIIIVAEGSLSFLGLGVPPPQPSWGGMIADGKGDLATRPYLVLIPAGVMFVTVFAFNVSGDRLRKRLEGRESVL